MCGLQTDGRIVACYGKSAVVDLFHVLSEEEVSAKVASRLKKARKRARFVVQVMPFVLRCPFVLFI